MQRSETIAALGAALAKAQGEIEGAKKDSQNPHFRSNYADLASCWDACRTALSTNGLAVIQAPGEAAEGVVEMTTMLVHESGEWISERLTIPLAKVDAQGYGSAVTYARRYALTAMVGIAPEDDDGNAAVSGGGASNSAPRRAGDRNEAPKVEEPPEGWSKWALDLQAKIATASDADTVEKLRAEADTRIRALRTIDQTIYNAIGKSFVDKRAALQPEPQKEAA